MFLGIILFVIFIAVFASLMNSGLWSNTITLINVLLAGLIATNYFEPVADFFDKQEPSFTYIWDFLAIWLVFCLAMIFLRFVTDFVSRIKVKFFMPVDRAGGIIMALWISWIMVCFATATLHTAPLARNFLWEAFQPKPNSRMFFNVGPDQVWLGWVHRESGGPLSRLGGISQFDPSGEFILKYGNRRDEFDQQIGLTKSKSGI
jgi:hypothetical protein